MKRNPLLLATASLILVATLRAQEPPLRDLLRDGLYAEEVTRDPTVAANHYEQVLARYSDQRAFAASALFRLAEVRRKQNRKEDAVKLYQQLLAEFPGAVTETKLARENLIALGGEPRAKENSEHLVDEESLELLRLQKLAKSSPDLLRKFEVLKQVVDKGWERPVAFLLDEGFAGEEAMVHAALAGHLAIVKMVIARGVKPEGEFGAEVLGCAIRSDSLEIVKTILAGGAPPNGVPSASSNAWTPLLRAVDSKNLEAARLLIEKGADVNLMPKEKKIHLTLGSSSTFAGAPLHLAILTMQRQMTDLLLAHKADVNLAEPRSRITPLWLAAGFSGNAPGLVKRLLDLGADPDIESVDEPDSKNQNWPGYPGKITPLELGIMNGSLENVKLLLEAKKSRNSPLGPMILHNARDNFEMTKLLLDYGAEPNPPKLKDLSILESWAGFSSGNSISVSRNYRDPEKIWQGMELLIERGSKFDTDWEKAEFPGIEPAIRRRLIPRYSYPRWAAEKSIRIVDLERDLQIERIAEASSPEAGPPILEEWLLHEEMRTLLPLIKDFTEFALIRKTGAGLKEIAILRLDAAESFPQLEWGDILEKRGVNRAVDRRNSSQQSWTREVREALQKRVKTQPVPTDQVPAQPVPADRAPRPRVEPPPVPSR